MFSLRGFRGRNGDSRREPQPETLPARARLMYTWEIENADVHEGRALSPMYLKISGRYYLTQSFQFRAGGPDNDLGAVVFDVTALPDRRRTAMRARSP